jgi:hypothetical protein
LKNLDCGFRRNDVEGLLQEAPLILQFVSIRQKTTIRDLAVQNGNQKRQ